MNHEALPLKCPCQQRSDLEQTGDGYVCTKTGCHHADPQEAFAFVAGVPVLISEALCDTVCTAGSTASYLPRDPSAFSKVKRALLGPSKVTQENCETFVARLLSMNEKPKVLVIGAGEKGSATEALWENDKIEIHGVDIYASPTVAAVCDAHYLPLESGSYDGVWIQAVLEHVVDPPVVVSEIHRVLKDKGVIYAETPFMQQVHEGAYDFTRYTVLGHRFLFRNFTLMGMGGLKGTDVALSWALRYFVWGVTRNRKLGGLTAFVSGVLLRPFGMIASKESLYDGPSGVFFMGEKSDKVEVTHKELIGQYKGQF